MFAAGQNEPSPCPARLRHHQRLAAAPTRKPLRKSSGRPFRSKSRVGQKSRPGECSGGGGCSPGLRPAAEEPPAGKFRSHVTPRLNSPARRMETALRPPTTRWSWSSIREAAHKAASRRVAITSARLGCGSPEGWLCTSTRPTARCSSTRFNTDRQPARIAASQPVVQATWPISRPSASKGNSSITSRRRHPRCITRVSSTLRERGRTRVQPGTSPATRDRCHAAACARHAGSYRPQSPRAPGTWAFPA